MLGESLGNLFINGANKPDKLFFVKINVNDAYIFAKCDGVYVFLRKLQCGFFLLLGKKNQIALGEEEKSTHHSPFC